MSQRFDELQNEIQQLLHRVEILEAEIKELKVKVLEKKGLFDRILRHGPVVQKKPEQVNKVLDDPTVKQKL